MKTQNYRYLLCMAVALLAACSDAGKGKESEEGVATAIRRRFALQHRVAVNLRAKADVRRFAAGGRGGVYVGGGGIQRVVRRGVRGVGGGRRRDVDVYKRQALC